MTNDYPPYWEGQIGIPFTRDEWLIILNNLRWEYEPFCSDPDSGCGCAEAGHIIDRIEKNLGIE